MQRQFYAVTVAESFKEPLKHINALIYELQEAIKINKFFKKSTLRYIIVKMQKN